ncbi:hypothetical protein [Aeromicrobium sp.]|uniref:hypothetical protein n=1 Tax=Aeromicrobium sp. TaxID=1871063 RepID=UPI00199DFEB4|nr:hypothetical protein [Aeromicrobium sp.]MBC7630373.1 hypothetical protein [Aeromicrobium sp.]
MFDQIGMNVVLSTLVVLGVVAGVLLAVIRLASVWGGAARRSASAPFDGPEQTGGRHRG